MADIMPTRGSITDNKISPTITAKIVTTVGSNFAMALSIGIGFTTTSESGIWAGFSPVVQSVFSANVVAVVFVVAIIMNLILPKDMEVQKLDN